MNTVTKEASPPTLFHEELSKIEKNISTLTKKNPTLVLGVALGTGVLMGYLGLRKIITVALWLKANDQIPYDKIFNNFSADKV